MTASVDQSFWFLTRGTGVVSLLLLTGVVVLGLSGAIRWSSPRWPRFVTQGLHRNLSLLAVAFIAVHVTSSVVDAFSPIRWLDAVVPFVSRYRPVWLGLGAVALDLLLALVVTSLVRVRLGYRSWRAVHWLAYACWPVAVLHGLGTGSDTREVWMLSIDAVAVGCVVAALAWRAGGLRPVSVIPRVTATAGSLAAAAAVVLWLSAGPLQPGWAREAGTPASLLGDVSAPAEASPAPASVAPLSFPDRAELTGTTEQTVTGGIVTLDTRGTLSGSTPISIEIGLRGQSDGSRLAVQVGAIRLGPPDDPARYQGRVEISNGLIVSRLSDASGSVVDVTITLHLVDESGTTQGDVRFATPGSPT